MGESASESERARQTSKGGASFTPSPPFLFNVESPLNLFPHPCPSSSSSPFRLSIHVSGMRVGLGTGTSLPIYPCAMNSFRKEKKSVLHSPSLHIVVYFICFPSFFFLSPCLFSTRTRGAKVNALLLPFSLRHC